jgi:hypothetical protein
VLQGGRNVDRKNTTRTAQRPPAPRPEECRYDKCVCNEEYNMRKIKMNNNKLTVTNRTTEIIEYSTDTTSSCPIRRTHLRSQIKLAIDHRTDTKLRRLNTTLDLPPLDVTGSACPRYATIKPNRLQNQHLYIQTGSRTLPAAELRQLWSEFQSDGKVRR